MAFWAAAIPAIASIAGGLIGRSGAQDANRHNLQIARETMAWQERMANTEMVRRVQDLKNADLNPMLAAMGGGASTPQPPVPTMQNENVALQQGINSAASAMLGAAQIRATNAQARKTEAEAQLTESEIPYSSANAATRSNILKRDLEMIGVRIDEQINKTDMSFTEAELRRELLPHAVKLQEALAKAEELGLSEKAAIAKLYESFAGVKGAERIIPLLLSIISAGRR